MSVVGRVRFPWSTQMTTRIPGSSARQQTGVAPSLLEPQSKDDALLHSWFPGLAAKALDLFSAEWRQTGLPLSGNYEAAKKLHDQLFREGKTRSKTSVRPRSLSATIPSDAGREPKSLTERAVHIPSVSAQESAPVLQKYPELSPEIISIDLTDFLAASVIEVKTEEASASIDATSRMRPEDEELCKELDKALEDWTERFKEIYKHFSRRRPNGYFLDEFRAHRHKLRQIYKTRLKGAEDQNALLLKHVTTHISDLLSIVDQSENFYNLATVAKSAKGLCKYYPDAVPLADLGPRLTETLRQLVARPDGSRREFDFEDGWILRGFLADAIVASDESSAQALWATAMQYCDSEGTAKFYERLEEADGARFPSSKILEYLESSLEQTARTIRNLSMRGSDQEAVELLRIAVWNVPVSRPPTISSGVLVAYQALSGRAKYLALKDDKLNRFLSVVLEVLPSTKEVDAARKEIKEFDPHLFALPEVSTGGEIVTIIKKLEEAFANLPEALAGNVAALLYSHIQEFLEGAATSTESPDERGARREVLLGALNYAFTIKRAIKSLVGLLSADEAFTVKSWFGREHDNPITDALYNRLKALGARDEDW
jgi:hypothetical protein